MSFLVEFCITDPEEGLSSRPKRRMIEKVFKGGDPLNPRTLITGILTLKLPAAKTCFKHRPIKHWKTTTLTKDGKKLKALASATRDSISRTNWSYSRTNAKI